jgi:uroporphyrinogen decarboxylase
MKERLSHRERVLLAVSHQETDRVPMDLGGTYASSITLKAYENLKRHLKLEHPTVVMRKWASVVKPDESILRYFDIDTRVIMPRAEEGWVEGWREEVLPEGGSKDEWGLVRIKPPDGNYFMTNFPLSGEKTIVDIERYPWPNPDDPERFRGLKDQAAFLRKTTDYALITMFPRPFVSLSQFLRGYTDWFTDLILNREFIETLMEKILEICLRIGKKLLEEIGDDVDFVFVHDDLATSNSLMMSPQMYREMIKPRHKKIFDLIKEMTRAKIIYHCDGAIYPLIQDFIDIGVDVLNPVQVSAKGVDTDTLKREFGEKLSFWGAIDTSYILPEGTAEEVKEEVKKRIDHLGKGGGYVVAPVHNILDEVPPENIVAMYQAAADYGRYR